MRAQSSTAAETSGPSVHPRSLGMLASGLLFASAVLQLLAAAQRWVWTDAGSIPTDRTIEDHVFDYVIPLDPWVSIGATAVTFGAAYLLIAASLVCLGLSRGGSAATVASVVAASPFVLFGAHGLVSGITGTPSFVQPLLTSFGAVVVGVLQVVALIVLAGFLARRSWFWAIGVLLLIGASIVGYIWASFTIAPWLMGYQSYDMTPWTEAVLGVATAAAALLVLVGSLRTTEVIGFSVR